MRRLALLLLSLVTMAADAGAQPAEKPPARPTELPAGHESVALGLAVGVGGEGGGPAGEGGVNECGELFAGWAFGRWAVMAWARGRRRDADISVFDLGLAGRIWPFPRLPRLYGELRASRAAYRISHEPGSVGDPEGQGANVGGGFGLELVRDRHATIDARAMVDRGILAEADDYTLISFALAVNVY